MSSLYVVYSKHTPRVKTCADCKYFVPQNRKCSKFQFIDIVTAEKVVLDAKIMRSETSFCGFGGVHYEYDPKKSHIHNPIIQEQFTPDNVFENYEPTAVD